MTTRFKLVPNQSETTFVQEQNTEAEAVYFELVAAVAAGEDLDLPDEGFHQILSEAGKSVADFIRDGSNWSEK